MSTTSKPTKPSVDELVLQLFNTVQQKQRDIAASEKPRWETTCTIGTEEGSVTNRINIQTVSDPAKLIDMLGFLLSKAHWYREACVKIENFAAPDTSAKVWTQTPLTPVFKWMGYTVDQWTKDFKTRLAQIELTAKRAELKTLEARLDKLISQDQRRELELAAIQKEMGL